MRIFKKILPKILFLVIFMTLLLLAITLGYSTWTFQSFVQETVDKQLSVVSRDIRSEIDSLNVMALEQIKAISYLHGTVEGVRGKDREALFRIVKSYQTPRKCEYFTILDAEGNVIIRTSDEKHLGGDSQTHLPCVKKAMEKKAGVYYETTPKVPLAIRAASPVLDGEGNLVGVVTGGFRLDTPEWVKHVKDTFGVESTTFVGKMRHITTLIHPSGPKKGELAIGTELDAPAVLKRVFDEKGEFHGEAMVLGRQMKVYYLPVLADSGQVLGLVFAGMPIDVQTGLVRSNFQKNLLIAVVGLLIFVAILYTVVRRIVGPIRLMTKASKDLSDGILDLDLDVRTGDELEVLAEAFKAVAASLKAKTEVALKISKGDLTTWVPLTSEHDSLGMALIEMRYGFYDSLKDLKSLAESVAEGGNELAQTNGLLVTNTNESASQLKDVSASLDDLNTQTKNNSENARNAEKLVGQAKRGSSEGLEKMNRMMITMDAIIKSSEEINSIIKVIDDIAFQTNLLALNAAVEAARAGVHGKGFAVVAEEVRNLAARSAKAANETAGLIQESIHQVGQGSGAAKDTSESLNTITGHVEEVSRIITLISRDSDEQTQRFGQVNSAVAQLSATADQNTGTVAEAAEAVTSITTTARKLDEITRHFRSNEGGKVERPRGDCGFVPVKN